MKIKCLVLFLVVLPLQQVFACDVCEKQQPEITRGITHGVGPQSDWDWVIIGVISVITVLTLVYSVKFLIKPGEKNRNHIKRSVLNN